MVYKVLFSCCKIEKNMSNRYIKLKWTLQLIIPFSIFKKKIVNYLCCTFEESFNHFMEPVETNKNILIKINK